VTRHVAGVKRDFADLVVPEALVAMVAETALHHQVMAMMAALTALSQAEALDGNAEILGILDLGRNKESNGVADQSLLLQHSILMRSSL